MPLQISRNDISRISADIIVCPTDSFLSGSGSIDKKIHELAGRKLDEECRRIGYLPQGQAVITESYDFSNCRYIIHTCGPVYIDGSHDEEKILASCYQECLKLAQEKQVESIAFPLIASGTFSFPKGKALKIASDVITNFLLDQEMQVYLLVYDKESFDTANKLYSDIHDYLEQNLESEYHFSFAPNFFQQAEKQSAPADYELGLRFEPDESFSECLIRMIDEKGLIDPEVYKKANIDRKHFNHIKNTRNYRPKKETAIALAIGLGLDLQETAILLERAGFVLSRSSKFDLIIRYCLEHNIKDIYRINEILFEEDQKTLGC